MHKMQKRKFVARAITRLRLPGYKGIHVVYSGFNSAFREYYGEDPRPYVDKLVREGFIILALAKGGAIIQLAGDREEAKGEDTPLTRILKE